MARKVAIQVYVSVEQAERLRDLAARTRVSMAEYIREGLDLVLDRYPEGSALHFEDGEYAEPEAP